MTGGVPQPVENKYLATVNQPLSDEQLAQLADLVAKRNQPSTPTGTPASDPWHVKRGDTDVELRSPADAQRLLEETERQYQAQLDAERIKREALEQQAEQARVEAARRNQPQPGADEFSKEKFAEQFLEDPRKSLHYAIKHDPVLGGVFQSLAQNQARLEQQIADLTYERHAEAFVRQAPDYVPNDENFKIMEQTIAQHNLPWTTAGMGLAWSYIKEQGLVDLADAAPAEQHVAPPSLGRGRRSSQVEPDAILEQFESLSPEKQKAYLESLTAR